MLFFSRARALARAREKKRNPKENFEAKNAGQKISNFESAVRFPATELRNTSVLF
jgi:hypothetical protein